jgi:hypothetical protein
MSKYRRKINNCRRIIAGCSSKSKDYKLYSTNIKNIYRSLKSSPITIAKAHKEKNNGTNQSRDVPVVDLQHRYQANLTSVPYAARVIPKTT